ncbi:YbdK family carboxylate-amine ligase [Streptomyces sp. NPDC059999]|uniref:carboxylate-amine ligase n=1 Tax=Streptomyces sp. NPDC059999 TaxID=3347030 RepID=UPI003677468B
MTSTISIARPTASPAAIAVPPRPCTGRLTVGVEEEFLLVDRASRTPVGRAPGVIAAVAPSVGDRVERELYSAQVEVHTDPATDVAKLRTQLEWLRREVAAAAATHDCLLLAVGTPVIPPKHPFTVTSDPRYEAVAARYAAVLGDRDQAANGCHIHVGVHSRSQALALANRIRPWLPVLQAIGANSPYDRGKDSGHASWRSVEHARWPTVAPAPVLDEAEYEHLASTLVRTGTILDRRMIYWYARPSEHVPTLEIRVADTNADLDVVILLAALVRGLATTFCAEIADSRPAPLLLLASLQEAHRLAALHRLSGVGLDPLCGIHLPPWRLVERLCERVAPALDASGKRS